MVRKDVVAQYADRSTLLYSFYIWLEAKDEEEQDGRVSKREEMEEATVFEHTLKLLPSILRLPAVQAWVGCLDLSH